MQSKKANRPFILRPTEIKEHGHRRPMPQIAKKVSNTRTLNHSGPLKRNRLDSTKLNSNKQLSVIQSNAPSSNLSSNSSDNQLPQLHNTQASKQLPMDSDQQNISKSGGIRGLANLFLKKKDQVTDSIRKFSNNYHSIKARDEGRLFSLNHIKLRINAAKAAIFQEAIAIQELANALDTEPLQHAFIHALHILERVKQDDGKMIITGMGKSSHIARKIATTLASTGTPSFFMHAGEASHGDLGAIGKRDAVMAISNSGDTKELFDIIDYCKMNEIPLIGMTRVANSNLAKKADVVLVLPNIPEVCPLGKAPTTSTTMCLVMGDALTVVASERHGFNLEKYRFWHPGGKLGASMICVKDVCSKSEQLLVVKHTDLLDDIIKACKKKDQNDIIIAVVDKKGQLIGQISTTKIIRATTEEENAEQLFAEEIMEKCVSVDLEQHIFDASKVLHNAKISSCIVTDKGKPVTTINLNDLLRTSNF